MAVLQIPVRVDPLAYSMTVELDGFFYTLLFRYNVRATHWFMDVSFNDVVVVTGIKIVNGVGLLNQLTEFVVDNRLPSGTVDVFDVLGLDREPDQITYGDVVVMLYNEVA